MNAQQVISMLIEAGATEKQSMLDVLCDGAALAALGLDDEDQDAVEEAYGIILLQESPKEKIMIASKTLIRTTVGLNATFNDTAPKLVRIECYKVDKGMMLQPVSGHNLAIKPGVKIISREDYDAIPRDAYDDTVFARACMSLCGYEA